MAYIPGRAAFDNYETVLIVTR